MKKKRTEKEIEQLNLSIVEQKKLVKEIAGKLADQKLKNLKSALQAAVIHSDTPIAPQELLVAAPGLYLDSVVGAQPSTEPYSELMRLQEVNMKEAEVLLKRTEGFSNQAKAAMQLAQMQSETINSITGILPDIATNCLTLSLKLPLPAGDWALVLTDRNNEEEKARLGTNFTGRYIIRFSWPVQQGWLEKRGP